jgi:uncharacterized membrane protein YfcA
MNIFELSILIIIIAFICEYVDSSLGMGYGTTLTPLLLIMGYEPLQIVPAVLLSELFTGLLAGFLHHKAKNVNLKVGTKDFKIAMVMAGCSIIGTVLAVFIALRVSTFHIKLYIAVLVLGMGIVILATLKRTFRFSWKKITSLGLLAAFNKGISGGGYGPIVTGGQILSGVNSKAAIGITSLSEGLVCLVGVTIYFTLTNHSIGWILAPSLILGAVLSVPFAALTVKKLNTDRMKLAVGIITLLLGIFTLAKIFI